MWECVESLWGSIEAHAAHERATRTCAACVESVDMGARECEVRRSVGICAVGAIVIQFIPVGGSSSGNLIPT